MTDNLLATIYNELHPTNNPFCDGEHCSCHDSIIRIIPIDNSYNANLCQACYEYELRYNEQLELDGVERILPDLPFSIYPVNHSL